MSRRPADPTGTTPGANQADGIISIAELSSVRRNKTIDAMAARVQRASARRRAANLDLQDRNAQRTASWRFGVHRKAYSRW